MVRKGGGVQGEFLVLGGEDAGAVGCVGGTAEPVYEIPIPTRGALGPRLGPRTEAL